MKLFFGILAVSLITGCSHWEPVKKCMDTVDRETQARTEWSLCKTKWWWE